MQVSSSRLLESALNIMKTADVKAGENVLLLADMYSDDVISCSLQMAGYLAGAEVTVVRGNEFPHYDDPFGKSFVDRPSDPVLGAVAAADLIVEVFPVLAVTWGPFHGALAKARKKSAKRVTQFGGKEVMTSELATFPLDVIFAIVRKVREFVGDGGTVKVVTPGGSDLSFSFQKEHLTGMLSNGDPAPGPLAPGQAVSFPHGVCGFMNPAVTGRAVCDRYRGFADDLREPMVLTYKNGVVTDVEGGRVAQFLHSKLGTGMASCSHLLFGINPKASLARDRLDPSHREAERSPACIDIHADREGVDRSAGFLLFPTVTVNGRTLIDHGRLTVLDDPKVVETAKRHGDPSRLLEMVP